MSVNLSPVAGAAAQFLDNSGNVLTGGKLYTYLAGTTTPAAVYTSSTGLTFHSNPIILDAAGRVPAGGEIWLSDNVQYKFVLKDSSDVLIGTWDNLTGINSNFVNYTSQEEIIVATAGQTVFNLSTVTYVPGTNSLQVYVDGVNQYDGVSYAYIETNATTVTFTSGLHVGALVKFTTAVSISSGTTNANLVVYDPAGLGAVATTVQDKLRECVSVKDFGAVGDGTTDDTIAIQAAIDSFSPGTSGNLLFPAGTYKVTSTLTANRRYINFYGDGISAANILYHPVSAGILFDLYTTVAENKAFSFANITLITDFVSAGTAIKISANLTASTNQVNGSNDSLYVNNVRIIQRGTGYWTIGLHSVNNGGMHFSSFTIDNTLAAPQNDVNTKGVYLELNDTKVHMVRTFMATDIYILRFYNGIYCTTPNYTTNAIESLYLANGEIVGISNAALTTNLAHLSAVAWTNMHVSTVNKMFDTELGYLAVARFTNCDFRRSVNGAPLVANPLFLLGGGIGVLFTNCYIDGDASVSSDPNTYCFKFTKTWNGLQYLGRFVCDNNTFNNFYSIYSNPAPGKGTCSNNNYNYVTNVVYNDPPAGNPINAYDAVISTTVVVTLTASGTFTVNVPVNGNYFSTQYVTAFLQPASPSGADVLTIYYDYAASTANQCVFKGAGNATFSGPIRFSFMATPILNQSTRA